MIISILLGLGVIVLGVLGIKYGIAAIIAGITTILMATGLKKD